MEKEDLLQYVWQYQAFDTRDLKTTDGQSVKVLKTGIKNTDSGPDFENARVVIDDLEWAGKIEIHTLSSEWVRHKHHEDPSYDGVILHVVWQHDREILRMDGSSIPTLELNNRISEKTIQSYDYLKNSESVIPCAPLFPERPSLTKTSMLEKALANRLERKAKEILQIYHQTNHDFDELSYQILMKNLGFKLNADAFFRLAQNLPYKIIRKENGKPKSVEALLFGQAGFLDSEADSYAKDLAQEYSFLSSKYGLPGTGMTGKDWKFLRTRPQNFPTVRLAQAAALLSKAPSLFSIFIKEENPKKLSAFFDSPVSEYWKNHFDWGKPSNKPNQIGIKSVENIIINTIVPLSAAYYYLTDEYHYFERAINILETLKPENNRITRTWSDLGLPAKTAFDSQAQIEQYNEFCLKKKCLSCPVGVGIIGDGNQAIKNQSL